ncbi:HEAT repeat domain-containing protein [Gloeobacter morelensis]|uniref:HEAT repeat domain-containing protein n=1 Tax=Gloeobacter morelensis MG652769 TaxID=2781736 RepID=A0ABY3PMQ8_9CYAN|nr:HEAT repeat domain-containing protein [Gloeobacter morelensis]UFP94884.1 HEAT repeat domain-containing protein [Gloeobacter morelensis MG652769]
MSLITPDTTMTVEEAVEQLRGEDLSQRYYAAWYLGYLEDPRAVEALVAALADESDRTEMGGYPLRRKAAESLGRIGEARAVPGLIEMLGCEDYYVREAAAWSLARIGDALAVEPLVALLGQGGSQPYEAIIEALGDLRVHRAVSLIEPFLQERSERVRYAAARSLFQLTGDVALIDMLLGGLASADSHIRRAALFDLADTGYLPAAAKIVHADVTATLKLLALKQLADVQSGDEPAAAVLPFIDSIL